MYWHLQQGCRSCQQCGLGGWPDVKLLPHQHRSTHLHMATIPHYHLPSFRGESFTSCYRLPKATEKIFFTARPKLKDLTFLIQELMRLFWPTPCKGLNSFQRLQSKERIFYHNKNPGIAIQAATHHLFCFCTVCSIHQQLKDWLCKAVASDLRSEKGIDPANDLGPIETWHFFFLF